MDPEVSAYLQQMGSRTREVRKVFIIAVTLCALLTLNVTFLEGPSEGKLGAVYSSLGPLLLWSLTAAAYAFHLLARAHARLTTKVRGVLAADRAEARRRLRAIKARLHRAGPAEQRRAGVEVDGEVEG
ncbi:MAG: hypothetical protein PVJ27_09560 [Candidatus Brocadiaceae bacterium]|jgi:hypothetical protein